MLTELDKKEIDEVLNKAGFPSYLYKWEDTSLVLNSASSAMANSFTSIIMSKLSRYNYVNMKSILSIKFY